MLCTEKHDQLRLQGTLQNLPDMCRQDMRNCWLASAGRKAQYAHWAGVVDIPPCMSIHQSALMPHGADDCRLIAEGAETNELCTGLQRTHQSWGQSP